MLDFRPVYDKIKYFLLSSNNPKNITFTSILSSNAFLPSNLAITWEEKFFSKFTVLSHGFQLASWMDFSRATWMKKFIFLINNSNISLLGWKEAQNIYSDSDLHFKGIMCAKWRHSKRRKFDVWDPLKSDFSISKAW